MAAISISRLPFSGAGGRITSPAGLMVLTAELAAIGVGEDAGGSSPSMRTASTSLPSVVPWAWPCEPSPFGSSYDPVTRISPVEATGPEREPSRETG